MESNVFLILLAVRLGIYERDGVALEGIRLSRVDRRQTHPRKSNVRLRTR